jgi:hypothetical protein
MSTSTKWTSTVPDWSTTNFLPSLSPLLGGVLARPATHWSKLFGGIPFFENHPYFLPCGAAASIALFSAMIAFVGLKEVGYYPHSVHILNML